ncbi:metal homeostatis protein bsd2 [Mycena rebaudengoi]|nr:metal homeostatis protein bsd2 [Mycena rebaudengoi]
MSARYAALPTQSARDADRELDAAFDSDDDEDTPLNPQSQSHPQSPRHPQPVPGAYDFEREYDCPPPGSPPPPSALALPNNIGNSNGMLPTDTVAPSAPRSSFFRRAVGALLPTHYTRVPGSDPRAGVHGGGIENDGVFANVMAKPQPARTAVTADGEIYMVPEDNQKEPPPSYASAQAEESVPPYWETTVHAPAGMDPGADMIIDDLPSGSSWVFIVNIFISFFFQFVGFLLTYLLHTSHAAKYGSRAGLGLTLIQYGFYSRAGLASEGEGDDVGAPPDWPESPTVRALSEPTATTEIVDASLGGVSSRDWLSFFLMTLGWFLLLSSFIGFWRIKRWEHSIRAAASAPPITAEDVERDAAVRRNLESVFGFSFERSEPRAPREIPRAHDERGIPTQELLEEARLARDLRAAGLL